MNGANGRRIWFRVHKWIGLALAVLIVPICLSGSLLVWGTALDRVANPGRYAVSGTRVLPPSRYLAAASGALAPGERVASLETAEKHGPVVAIAIRRGAAVRTELFLDPPTARVLAVSRAGGAVRFLHRLHGSLFVAGWGRTIVGWVGVALALSCLSGLWLWWPTVGRWVRGLRWRRHRDTDTNLHYLTGFWVAVPLFVLAVSGAWIAGPGLFGPPPRRRPAPAMPLARPALAVDAVVARAQQLGNGHWRSVAWPTERSADWTVTFAGRRSVKVADDAGTVVPGLPPPGARGTAGLMRRLHSGEDTGPIWQLIIVLAGLAPAVLATTGVLMWRRERRRAGSGRGSAPRRG